MTHQLHMLKMNSVCRRCFMNACHKSGLWNHQWKHTRWGRKYFKMNYGIYYMELKQDFDLFFFFFFHQWTVQNYNSNFYFHWFAREPDSRGARDSPHIPVSGWEGQKMLERCVLSSVPVWAVLHAALSLSEEAGLADAAVPAVTPDAWLAAEVAAGADAVVLRVGKESLGAARHARAVWWTHRETSRDEDCCQQLASVTWLCNKLFKYIQAHIFFSSIIKHFCCHSHEMMWPIIFLLAVMKTEPVGE